MQVNATALRVAACSHAPGKGGECNDAQIGLSCVNNTIRNLPREYHDAVGVLGLYLNNAIIAHNSLENLSYSGINLGYNSLALLPLLS